MGDLHVRLGRALGSAEPAVAVAVGCDLSDAGRHEDAEACFRHAIALGEDWVSFNLGNELAEQGRLTQAVEAYLAAVDAGETDAWLNLGLVLEDLGDLAGAQDAYREAGEAGDLAGYLQWGHLLRDQGEPDQAEQVVALGASRGHRGAAAILAGWRYRRTGDPALEPELRVGVEHDGEVRASLADLLRASGRVEEARQQLERGAKLGQTECWPPLGNLLLDELDKPEAAEDAYRAGIAAGDAYCHHNLGLLLLAVGRRDEAEAQFLAGAVAGDALASQALQGLHTDD